MNRTLTVLSFAALLILEGVASAAPPNAPGNLVVTTVAGQCKMLRLTWNDNSTNESDFHIERAADASGSPNVFVEIATRTGGSGTTKSFTDTSVVDGTRHWYRVRAHRHDTDEFSAYSNSASNFAPPCAPTGLTVMDGGCGTLNLTWIDNDLRLRDGHDSSGYRLSLR